MLKPPLTGFHGFKDAISTHWKWMSENILFRTEVSGDAMWSAYLESFPAGSNLIFRERTEHDCTCCRQFIRAVGNAVTMIDGKLVSLWDAPIDDNVYSVVANAMSKLVKSAPIDNIFFHTERHAGTDKNRQDVEGKVITWDHLFVEIPHRNSGISYVQAGKDIGSLCAEARASHDVLFRGLKELTLDAMDSVLELISQGSLYRGEEHKSSVTVFRKLKQEFDKLSDLTSQDIYAWQKSRSVGGAISKFRNTSIGQLVTDLSDGKDLEVAVRAFEVIMAPENYKRPTALVTKAMVNKARDTVESLGLTSALERRYATLRDVSVNNVLFADRSIKNVMANSVFDDINASVRAKPRDLDKVEEIGIDKFLTDVLPKVESLELLVEGRLTGRLVSLIAPLDQSAATMFKWDNRFSWSYQGEVADSIKERVKQAGGNVTGDLCCRLAWSNYDDLDLHMYEPDRNHVYFGAKDSKKTGGQLDVDMNAGGPRSRTPVENIFYRSENKMIEGVYSLSVNQFAKRDTADVGFEVEIDWKGTVYHFSHPEAVRPGQTIKVADLKYGRKTGLEVIGKVTSKAISRKVWNIDTETFQRVNVVMLSPNHWDGHGVGNRHLFFMIDGCQNDGKARGFYNEFLRSDLDAHRRVLELVGGKMLTEESYDQLSGLGFSSTQHDSATVRVKGAITRTLKINF